MYDVGQAQAPQPSSTPTAGSAPSPAPAPYTRGNDQPPQSPNAAPPGRPSGGGIEFPEMPGEIAPPPGAQSVPYGPSSARMPAPPPGQSAWQPQQVQPSGNPGQLPQQPNMQRPVVTRVSPEDLRMMPAGSAIETAMGTVSKSATGEVQFQLNDAGRQAYEQAVQREMQKFGEHPARGLAGAPQPEVLAGKPNYNPFRGGNGWSDGWMPGRKV